SGCGGLSLGAKQAGFTTALAVDNDPILSGSFGTNFPGTNFLLADAAKLDARALRRLLPNGATGIIGGPPCQAFSEIGRRIEDDPRRFLVDVFFRIVSELRPTFFLMENVRGLGFAKNRAVLEAGLGKLRGRFSVIGPLILDAANFGAPTRRKRLFVFGFDPEYVDVPSAADLAKQVAGKHTVRDAIADLLGARQLSDDAAGYDRWRYRPSSDTSRYANKMRSKSGIFTGNRRTKHTKATIRRFSQISPGGIDAVGKHQRLAWNDVCPTLRAGTGNDRGSYQAVRPLHPIRDRVISVREAARLQGFPDEFVFHPTIWHSFRMIGNSVSPIIACELLKRIASRIDAKEDRIAA
ncbi:DNA cytosine methyltransferase, partial [Candidatus Sumerlaeota bacterium]|nr:DNA cytosine methyltransferase [Candidatus Sumerlaeota bacterium]